MEQNLKFKCPVCCEKEFTTRKELQQHVQQLITQLLSLKCCICSKKFNSLLDYNGHLSEECSPSKGTNNGDDGFPAVGLMSPTNALVSPSKLSPIKSFNLGEKSKCVVIDNSPNKRVVNAKPNSPIKYKINTTKAAATVSRIVRSANEVASKVTKSKDKIIIPAALLSPALSKIKSLPGSTTQIVIATKANTTPVTTTTTTGKNVFPANAMKTNIKKDGPKLITFKRSLQAVNIPKTFNVSPVPKKIQKMDDSPSTRMSTASKMRQKINEEVKRLNDSSRRNSLTAKTTQEMTNDVPSTSAENSLDLKTLEVSTVNQSEQGTGQADAESAMNTTEILNNDNLPITTSPVPEPDRDDDSIVGFDDHFEDSFGLDDSEVSTAVANIPKDNNAVTTKVPAPIVPTVTTRSKSAQMPNNETATKNVPKTKSSAPAIKAQKDKQNQNNNIEEGASADERGYYILVPDSTSPKYKPIVKTSMSARKVSWRRPKYLKINSLAETTPANVNYVLYECKVCHRRYRTLDILSEHKCETFCQYCNVILKSCHAETKHGTIHRREMIEDSLNIRVTSSRVFHCNTCFMYFNEDLKDAHREAHVYYKIVLRCETCNHFCLTKKTLKTHIEKEHFPESDKPKRVKQTETECKIVENCNLKFRNITELREHWKVHFEDGIVKPYKCPHCGKLFRKRCEMVKHSRIHTGEKPYPCSLCEKTFRCSFQRHMHLRTHTNERPYHCDKCDKKFKSSSNLTFHRAIHFDERNYSCVYCDRKFKTIHSMINHRLIHLKPVKCPDCSRVFNAKNEMNQHRILMHLNERKDSYKCVLCDAVYGRKFALAQHLKTHENVVKRGEVALNHILEMGHERNEDPAPPQFIHRRSMIGGNGNRSRRRKKVDPNTNNVLENDSNCS